MLKLSKKCFSTENVLVTGCSGQIGKYLVHSLVHRLGSQRVICSDLKEPSWTPPCEFKYLDITNTEKVESVVKRNNITVVYHMAALLSMVSEQFPDLCMKVNVEANYRLFKVAQQHRLRLFIPSTIGVYGDDAPKENTKESVSLNPIGIYGVTKVLIENMGCYFHSRHGVDFRSLRYPSVVSPNEFESNGTGDYASLVFFDALRGRKAKVDLNSQTSLPVTYLSDLVEGTIDFVTEDNANLTRRVYNMSSMSFKAQELLDIVSSNVPSFEYEFCNDIRNTLAESWPNSLDTAAAERDWGWNPTVKSVNQLSSTMFKDIERDYGLKI